MEDTELSLKMKKVKVYTGFEGHLISTIFMASDVTHTHI